MLIIRITSLSYEGDLSNYIHATFRNVSPVQYLEPLLCHRQPLRPRGDVVSVFLAQVADLGEGEWGDLHQVLRKEIK